jgi:type II secretory pathway component GspD/PulD (secretin)
VGKRYVPNVSVRGTDQEQRLAKEVVDQWIENTKKPTRTFANLYTLKSALATDVITQLQRLVPAATLVAGTSTNTILARALEEDHELLEQLIRQLDQPASDERVVEIYELPGGNVTSLRGLLDTQTAAQIQTAPAGRDQVIVRATPEVQQKIKAVVDKIGPAMDARSRMVSYVLEDVDPQEAWTVLRTIAPQAVMVVQPKSKSLAVSAIDEDHRRIAEALREIDRPGEKGKQHQALVVPIDMANPTQLLSMLQKIYAQERELAFSYDDKTRSILIVGNPDRHEEIKQIIAKADIAKAGREPHVEVYRLRNVQPQEAAGVLRGIVPTATIVVQASTRSLAVSSDDQGQRRVADAIGALERATEHTESQKVSIIPIVEAEPQTLLRLLQTKYAGETDLTFSYDTGTRSILVVGPADRHEEIKKILVAADSADSGHAQRVVVYPLGRINGYIAQQMVNQLMAKERIPVTLSYEPGGNQLVVVAHDRQQAVIREALEQLQPPETDFAVFALQQLDPLIAEDAVIGLFAGALEGGSAPVVDVDQDNNRLYVRATPKQLAKIRDLLTKMGERQLDPADSGFSRKKTRFVPLSGDEQEAIESIRAVWPKLRNNDLRVLDREQLRGSLPREPAAPLLPNRKPPAYKRPASKPPATKSPAPRAPDNSSGQQKTGPATDRVGTGLWESLLGMHPISLFCQVTADSGSVHQATGKQTVGEAAGDRQPDPGGRNPDPVGPNRASGPPKPGSVDRPTTLPPVYIVPGPQGVTIMSEDTGALDQLEQLLSVVSQPQSRGSRRMFVYPLKSSSASRLADTLNKLYRYVPNSSRGRTSRGRTTFVADERLNALVVFASRSDRQEIEELLEILDVEQTPDMQATHRPVVIPLQHARAVTVEQQLRLLYKTQLTAGGKQPAMEIPSGTNARAAALIEQINAVRLGSLMTLGIDEDTNSILVVAPPSLIEEVRRFAEELDRAADEHPRRAVRIMPLKKTNAAEMDRALQRVLRARRRRR